MNPISVVQHTMLNKSLEEFSFGMIMLSRCVCICRFNRIKFRWRMHWTRLWIYSYCNCSDGDCTTEHMPRLHIQHALHSDLAARNASIAACYAQCMFNAKCYRIQQFSLVHEIMAATSFSIEAKKNCGF